MNNLKWHTRKDDNEHPIEAGTYRVMILGDSESLDGHLIYSFDDYVTWAEYVPDEDGGSFKGSHDEEDCSIFAWYGPINIPPYEAPND